MKLFIFIILILNMCFISCSTEQTSVQKPQKPEWERKFVIPNCNPKVFICDSRSSRYKRALEKEKWRRWEAKKAFEENASLNRSINGLNCFPKSIRSKPKRYLLVTVKGDTYGEAKARMERQMPQAGFNQRISRYETKVIKDHKYSEKVVQKAKFKAKMDMWKTYKCKHQGEYYISAAIPKKGIKYVDKNVPDYFTLDYVKGVCGDQKIFIETAYNFSLKDQMNKKPDKLIVVKRGERASFRVFLYCGPTKWWIRDWYGNKHWYDNDFENFRAIESGYFGRNGYRKYKSFKDITTDMWLHLTKD